MKVPTETPLGGVPTHAPPNRVRSAHQAVGSIRVHAREQTVGRKDGADSDAHQVGRDGSLDRAAGELPTEGRHR